MSMASGARDYLIGSQRPDGSWGSGDPFVCARALYALRDGMPRDTLTQPRDTLTQPRDTLT
ncbi:MAG TPA: hypothetical protein VMC61_02455, partial [Methanocella sp.]|nr:hypothetical protein [Methanocella sp.]